MVLWEIANRQANSFLKIISPYLRLKHIHAETAIKFQSLKAKQGQWRCGNPKPMVLNEAEEILRQKMLELNQKGIK